MEIVTAQQLERWIASGNVLERDARGPKVIALPDGLFLKIFYTRRKPFLARLQPPARTFARNAERLRQAGIPAPETQRLFWLDRPAGLSACLYHPLPGQSIEQLLRRNPEQINPLLPSLALFIRRLHRRGIYFRSLHLGNILQLPDGQYGLIDILDLQFKFAALNRWQVRRNFDHLRNYLARQKLQNFPIEQLLALYQDAP
ncbi:toluene tolerance protein [Pseudomonas sp. N040]|uniref:toluene tolerance protein n=1 Tax=Pseudomonas sp. N040 TaxID=2785325 RepID=UPI0018A26CF4|nr:toluene tolerance protein [Pseudomonas sp. N040]MBF7729844.1 toluene tolerance protein [Pseudomonas sp. N040]MBW7013486.1 toluene tolerance protein [Pseudomonas sp. N040]